MATKFLGFIKNGVQYITGFIPDNFPLRKCKYNNTSSGLSATNGQEAIDEVAGQIGILSDRIRVIDFDFSNVSSVDTWLSDSSLVGMWYVIGSYAVNTYGTYFDNSNNDLYQIAGSFTGTTYNLQVKAQNAQYYGGYARCKVLVANF